ELKNRCVLAPMTRERCDTDGVPTALHAAYFAQRAGAGLLVSGNNRVSLNAACSPHSSGLHSAEQVQGWRNVTDAVHAAGGLMFAQIFHSGACGHPDIIPGAGHPVAPSAVAWGGPVRTMYGKVEGVVPQELSAAQIADIVGDFAETAKRAVAAGFDGVEVHASSGYLFEQFFSSGTNLRLDAYGGSVANRCRMFFETVEAVAAVVGSDRTGAKISPEFNKYGVVVDENPQETFGYIARTLGDFDLAYLHVADNSLSFDYHAYLRPLYSGCYIAGVGFTPERAMAYIESGQADLISFGRLFISNPDLPERIRTGSALNPIDPSTVYTATARGLLDYPTMVADSGSP
ncbi:MAG: alkene reductase, partial [Salaquimonas sp.]|nr:alkene reductase [Salaquimonas sp.]